MNKVEMQQRTKDFAKRIIVLCRTLPGDREGKIIGNQVFRSATSVAANYRAACRARSKADFVSKLAIVEEEADETLFWLELLAEMEIVENKKLAAIMQECNEIISIVVASIKTVKLHNPRSTERSTKSQIHADSPEIRNPKSQIPNRKPLIRNPQSQIQNRKGFTLIELIVSTAIIAILAGIMVPMIHKIWESNEIAETRGRMYELKRAIVGDQQLVQNGIRMHYGFVGDNGGLPDSINDLVADSGAFANWNGPYMVGAFEPSEYNSDAWHNAISYTIHSPPLTVSGQQVAATLRSGGLDGILGNGDDINENSDLDLQILESEVWPTAMVQGNFDYVFAAAVTVTPAYYTGISVTYSLPSGFAMASSSCLALSIGQVEAGVPKSVRQAFLTGLSATLPVGRIYLRSHLYSDGLCTAQIGQTNDVAVFVSQGLNAVSVNLPTLHYSIP